MDPPLKTAAEGGKKFFTKGVVKVIRIPPSKVQKLLKGGIYSEISRYIHACWTSEYWKRSFGALSKSVNVEQFIWLKNFENATICISLVSFTRRNFNASMCVPISSTFDTVKHTKIKWLFNRETKLLEFWLPLVFRENRDKGGSKFRNRTDLIYVM